MIIVLVGVSHAPPAHAQNTFSINVSTTIPGSFSIETQRIDFGRLVPGVTQVLAPQPGGQDGRAGQIVIAFDTDGISVTVPSQMTLSGPGGQIRAALTCARADSRQSSQATPFACAEGVVFTTDGSKGGSQRVVYVGGTLPASETQGKQSGTYTGAVVITGSNTAM